MVARHLHADALLQSLRYLGPQESHCSSPADCASHEVINTVKDPTRQGPELSDRETTSALDHGTHMMVSIRVSSGNLQAPKDFITRRVNNAARDK